MKRFKLPAGCLIVFLLISHLVSADTSVISGKHRLVLDIINPTGIAHIPDYKNSGFSQKVLEKHSNMARVEIKIDMSPFRSGSPFPVNADSLPADVKKYLKSTGKVQADATKISNKAKSLVRGTSTQMEAFERIAHWIADQVNYEIHVPQDASSVFRNKLGSCSGQTRLTMAMLRSVGIPARYVIGYMPPGKRWGFSKKYFGVELRSGGHHAWIEVYFPDKGWVFSDMLHSLYFVDPYHIVFHIRGSNLNTTYNVDRWSEDVHIEFEKGTSFTIYEEQKQTRIIDRLPLPKKWILSRQTRSQKGCAVYGQVLDSSGGPLKRGEFVVYKQGGYTVSDLQEDGRFSVSGLEPGDYEIGARSKTHAEKKQKVSFSRPGTKELTFRLEPGGSLQGKVRDKNGRPVPGAWIYVWKGKRARGHAADGKGNYIIKGLEPGEYRVTAKRAGAGKAGTRVTIKADETTENDFILE